MLRLLALTGLIASVSAVKEVVWNGRPTSFDNDDNWKGAYPLASSSADQPGYVSFGKEGGSITATTKGDTTYVVGKKMTLNGKVKIVLGDGNAKTTLKFAEGKGGPSTFLPGSNTELDDNTKMQGFDFNCHMNWRQAEDPDLYVTKPPCENDKIYMVTDDDTTGSRRFKAPANIEPGAGIYASTFGVKSYFRRMYISSPDEPGNAPSIGTDLCENGDAIVKGSITVDLGVCGDRNNNGYDTYISAGTGQTNDECVSTCPPEGILEDGSILQAVPSEDDDDGIVYIQINGDGEDTGATVEVVVDGDGHTTFTVTDKDGTVQDHINGSNSNDGSSDASIGGTPDASGGNSTTVVIVVVVVLVLIVIIVAVVYVMKAGGNSGGAGAQGVVSFENPMYDTANKQNPAANYAMPQGGGAAASSGYMDVPVGGGDGGGYTEPSYAH
eukprot:gene14193-25849_t